VGWRAARRGLRVVVLERGEEPARETSAVAAGMLAPISETLADWRNVRRESVNG